MEKQTTQNIQDAFLNAARRDRTEVVFQLMQGAELSGSIKSFDKFSVLLDLGDKEVLVFKHAISTVSIGKQKDQQFKVKYLGRKTNNV
ncbi:MAG: RNA chaperone Hfq [Acidobacteria bacterium]|nr:RNA chaperone Hfq [Acidobacteriota bacterium]